MALHTQRVVMERVWWRFFCSLRKEKIYRIRFSPAREKEQSRVFGDRQVINQSCNKNVRHFR